MGSLATVESLPVLLGFPLGVRTLGHRVEPLRSGTVEHRKKGSSGARRCEQVENSLEQHAFVLFPRSNNRLDATQHCSLKTDFA